MILWRTPAFVSLSCALAITACQVGDGAPQSDEPFVPVGPPVIALLVDATPELSEAGGSGAGFVEPGPEGARYGDPFTVRVSKGPRVGNVINFPIDRIVRS